MSGFDAKLKAALEKASTSVKVRTDPDTAGFSTKLKAAVAMAARDASANIQIGVSGDIDSQLRNLSRKLQQNKVSDLLDLNLNQTQIDQQLLLLKRRIDAAHFSDMLSFDVNQTAIDQQLALIKRKMDAAKFSDLLSFNIDQAQIDTQLADLSRKINAVEDVQVAAKVDSSQADRAIDEIKARLDSLHDKTVHVDVKQTGDKTSLAGGLGGALSSVTGTSGASGVADMTMLGKAILALNVATGIAEPALAALTVTVGALVSSAAAAGIGLGAYAAAVKPQLTAVTQAMTDQAAAATGSAAAVKKYQADLAGLSGPQKTLLTDMTGAKKAFTDWSNSLAGVTLKPLETGLSVVSPLLHDLTPFVKDAASALDGLMTKLAAGVKSNGFQEWLKAVEPLVKPLITDLGTAIGHIVVGFGGIIKAFLPFDKTVLGGLDDFTKKFSTWAQSLGDGKHTGFNALISDFQQNWPLVKQGLSDFAGIIKNVLADMTGLATGANSKALWDIADPMLAMLKEASSHPDLVRALLYLLAVKDAAGKISGVFSGIKYAANAMSSAKTFLGLLFSGKNPFTSTAIPMQTAGDTMAEAAAAMQRAADTMVGAAGEQGVAAGEEGAAATSIGAGFLGMDTAGMAAMLGPVVAVLIASYVAGKFDTPKPGTPASAINQGATGPSATPKYGINEAQAMQGSPFTKWLPQGLSDILGHFMSSNYGDSGSGPHQMVGGPSQLQPLPAGPNTPKGITGDIGQIRHDFAQWVNDARREVGTIWDGMRHEVAHVLSDIRHDFAQWVNDARRQVGNIFDGMRHEAAHVLADIRHDIAQWVGTARHDTSHLFDDVRHGAARTFDDIRHDIAHWVSVPRHDVAHIFDDLRHGAAVQFDGIRHDIASWVGTARHDISHIFDDVRHGAAHTFDDIRHDIAHWVDDGRHEVAHLFDDVYTWFAVQAARIAAWISGIPGLVTSRAASMFDSVYTWFAAQAARIASWFGSLPGIVASKVSGMWSSLWSDFQTEVVQPVTSFIASIPGLIGKAVGGLGDTIKNAVGNIPGIGGALKKVLGGQHGGQVPGYAPGQDSVHTVLSPGEYVIVPEAVRALGPGYFADINKRYDKRATAGAHTGLLGYAAGGPVPAPVPAVSVTSVAAPGGDKLKAQAAKDAKDVGDEWAKSGAKWFAVAQTSVKKNVADPLAKAAGTDIPSAFAKSVGTWYTGHPAALRSMVTAPVTALAGVTIPGAFAKSVPAWYSAHAATLNSKVAAPLSALIGSTVPAAWNKSVPTWYTTHAATLKSQVATPVATLVNTTIPGQFNATIPKWYDAHAAALNTQVIAPVRTFVDTTVPAAWGASIPHWFTTAAPTHAAQVQAPLDTYYKTTLPTTITTGFTGAMTQVGAVANKDIGALNAVTKVGGISPVGSLAFALGGVMPGYEPGRDTMSIMVGGGEGILVPEAVRGLGGAPAIDAINRRFAGHRGAGFADGGVSGSSVASYATGVKNLYTWGGAAPPHTDCSGFSAACYEHFSLIPAKPGSRWGTADSQFTSPLLAKAGEQPGAMVFFAGSDGTASNPGHVGIALGGGKYVGADGPQGADNRIEPSSGNLGFRVPKQGWISGGVLGQLVAAMVKTEPFGKAAAAKAGGQATLAAAGAKPVADALVGASGYGYAAGGTVPDTLNDLALHQIRASTEKSVTAKVKAEAAALAAMSSGGDSGAANSGPMSAAAIAAMWTKDGGPASAAANMAKIAFAESGDDPSIVQKGQPPGLTGYGLYQITPTSGITQNGKFGNLLNADNNTKAAISLFSAAGGYSPWTSDPVGAGLVGTTGGGSTGNPGGSMYSYAGGGIIPEPVAGYGLRTGQSYSFAERGPETVIPGTPPSSGTQSSGGGTVVNFNYYGPQQPGPEHAAGPAS